MLLGGRRLLVSSSRAIMGCGWSQSLANVSESTSSPATTVNGAAADKWATPRAPPINHSSNQARLITWGWSFGDLGKNWWKSANFQIFFKIFFQFTQKNCQNLGKSDFQKKKTFYYYLFIFYINFSSNIFPNIPNSPKTPPIRLFLTVAHVYRSSSCRSTRIAPQQPLRHVAVSPPPTRPRLPDPSSRRHRSNRRGAFTLWGADKRD